MLGIGQPTDGSKRKAEWPIPDANLKSGRPQGNEKYQPESSGTDRVLGLQASGLFTP